MAEEQKETTGLGDVDLTQTPPEQKAEELEKKKDESPVQEEPKTVDQVLRAFPDAPSPARIEEWKVTHGEILCSGFSNTELFVFRPLTRQEFVNLQTVLAQATEPVTQYDVEAKIVTTCVLWSSTDGGSSLANKGGSLSTLHEQIMQASNFMNPALAASYVARL